jgi:hypothetical protein
MMYQSQQMDAILQHDMDSCGGRYISKQPEPLKLDENPLLKEMRLMHMDFAEESYWKRCAALKLATACKNHLLSKGKTSKSVEVVQPEILRSLSIH